jgi:HAD superfamily hydrolase (TIGR01549 family)
VFERKGVIFDAFGTLLQIRAGKHPFLQLIRHGRTCGRRPQSDDIRRIMCSRWTLRDTAEAVGIPVPELNMLKLEAVLREEVDAIEPYPEAQEAVELLRSNGFAVSVCSNLGLPYGDAIRRWFPALDAYALSYEFGAMKPDPNIYEYCCTTMGTHPLMTSMIGDSQQCDRDGPSSIGVRGYYLDRDRRNSPVGFADLLSFAKFQVGHDSVYEYFAEEVQRYGQHWLAVYRERAMSRLSPAALGAVLLDNLITEIEQLYRESHDHLHGHGRP